MLTVLIATKDRAGSLAEVLRRYTRLAEPVGGWEIIVADGGTDSTPDVVRSFADRLPVIYLAEPRAGKSVALNAGIEFAKGDPILFTDDDILPPAPWLTLYQEAAASQPGYDVFCGPVSPKWPFDPPSWAVRDRRVRTACFMDTGQPHATGPTDTWVTGQNLAIRRRVLTPDKRFDARLGPEIAMGEEVELVGRLSRDGAKVWWIAEALVEHIIRPEQFNRSWMLRRAGQFGRGQYLLDAEFRRPAPQVAGVPRWMIRRVLEQSGCVAAAWVRGSRHDLFMARWDLNYYRGALSQAWRARNATGPVAGRRLTLC